MYIISTKTSESTMSATEQLRADHDQVRRLEKINSNFNAKYNYKNGKSYS